MIDHHKFGYPRLLSIPVDLLQFASFPPAWEFLGEAWRNLLSPQHCNHEESWQSRLSHTKVRLGLHISLPFLCCILKGCQGEACTPADFNVCLNIFSVFFHRVCGESFWPRVIPTRARPGRPGRPGLPGPICRAKFATRKLSPQATGFTCDGLDEFCAEKERRATVAKMACC